MGHPYNILSAQVKCFKEGELRYRRQGSSDRNKICRDQPQDTQAVKLKSFDEPRRDLTISPPYGSNKDKP